MSNHQENSNFIANRILRKLAQIQTSLGRTQTKNEQISIASSNHCRLSLEGRKGGRRGGVKRIQRQSNTDGNVRWATAAEAARYNHDGDVRVQDDHAIQPFILMPATLHSQHNIHRYHNSTSKDTNCEGDDNKSIATTTAVS